MTEPETIARHRQRWEDAGIPFGLCLCGCGKATNAAQATRAEYGHIKGQPMFHRVGHSRRESVEDRFWRRVDKGGGPDACWEWTGYLHANGYGTFGPIGPERRKHMTHRVAYELLIGSIPGNLPLDHLCRNRACVNPAHLEPVTHKENSRRGEGPSAQNSAKTHCDRGHVFDEANTHITPSGHRGCRACRRDYQKARRAANPRPEHAMRRCERCGANFVPHRSTQLRCPVCIPLRNNEPCWGCGGTKPRGRGVKYCPGCEQGRALTGERTTISISP